MNQSDNKTGTRSSNQKTTSNRGNFKNDPQRAAEAGRKGGEHSHSGSRKS